MSTGPFAAKPASHVHSTAPTLERTRHMHGDLVDRLASLEQHLGVAWCAECGEHYRLDETSQQRPMNAMSEGTEPGPPVI